MSIPERNWSDPFRGLGVVGRDGMGVADLEITPFSLDSLGSVDRRQTSLSKARRVELIIAYFYPVSRTF